MFWEERSTVSSPVQLARGADQPAPDGRARSWTITRETVGQIDTASEIWQDAAAFEAQLDAAGLEHRPVIGAPSALFQGDFLAGFYVDSSAFEEWSTRERERLRLRAMNVLDALVTAHRASSDYQTGLARANQLLTLDPLRETTYQHLMQLLALSGEREAALASTLPAVPCSQRNSAYTLLQKRSRCMSASRPGNSCRNRLCRPRSPHRNLSSNPHGNALATTSPFKRPRL